MPLITICGLPVVGKSTFASRLASSLHNKSPGTSILIINEEALSIEKSIGYADSAKEKVTRSSLKSAVERSLTGDAIVILDSMNYIKGYRYEIFCIARSLRTPCCTVLVEADDAVSDSWNMSRAENERFESAILRDLRMRFERPEEKNRWDCPLFHVNMTPNVEHTDQPSSCERNESSSSSLKVRKDSNTSEPAALPTTVFRRTAFKKSVSVTPEVISKPQTLVDEDKTVESVEVQSSAGLSISGSYIHRSVVGAGSSYEEVISAISDYLETAIAPAPNSSTIPKVHASADLLYQLDQVSQTIVQKIVQHQKDAVVEGTPLVFSEYDRSIVINRHVGISELQRHRRQFVKVNTMHPPSTGIDVGATFVDFLAQQL